MVSGDYKIIINIEDDSVTCNSHTVFSQLGRNAEHHNFFYVDRHGNWVETQRPLTQATAGNTQCM